MKIDVKRLITFKLEDNNIYTYIQGDKIIVCRNKSIEESDKYEIGWDVHSNIESTIKKNSFYDLLRFSRLKEDSNKKTLRKGHKKCFLEQLGENGDLMARIAYNEEQMYDIIKGKGKYYFRWGYIEWLSDKDIETIKKYDLITPEIVQEYFDYLLFDGKDKLEEDWDDNKIIQKYKRFGNEALITLGDIVLLKDGLLSLAIKLYNQAGKEIPDKVIRGALESGVFLDPEEEMLAYEKLRIESPKNSYS